MSHRLPVSRSNSRHTLAYATDPETPDVTSDKVQLELALLNLILNARDAMPGGGQVTLHAGPLKENGRACVAISVSDTGSGMDAATIARAREPFFTTKAQGAGTGLGLAQVAEVARQSDGRLDIDSTPGRGTTARLILPAAKLQAVSAIGRSRSQRDSSGEAQTIDSRRQCRCPRNYRPDGRGRGPSG